jgi:hypothetical protein
MNQRFQLQADIDMDCNKITVRFQLQADIDMDCITVHCRYAHKHPRVSSLIRLTTDPSPD